MRRKLFIYSPSSSDNTNNIVDFREYDYGDTSGSQGALIRRTHTDFLTSYNNPAAGVYLRDLPSNQTVYDGLANVVAQTKYFYEGPGSPSPQVIPKVEITPILNGTATTFTHTFDCSGVSGTRAYTLTDQDPQNPSVPAPVPGHVYLYRVRALDAAGNLTNYSNNDFATTIVF